MVEGEGVEAGAGGIDDGGVGADEAGLGHKAGDHFADVALVDSDMGNAIAAKIFLGIEDRFGAEFNADHLLSAAGCGHAEGSRTAVEVVDDRRGGQHGEGRVVELFGCKSIGLEKGNRADLKGQRLLFEAELFDDVVGTCEVHFIKICGASLFRLVDAEENGRISRNGAFDSRDIAVEMGPS